MFKAKHKMYQKMNSFLLNDNQNDSTLINECNVLLKPDKTNHKQWFLFLLYFWTQCEFRFTWRDLQFFIRLWGLVRFWMIHKLSKWVLLRKIWIYTDMSGSSLYIFPFHRYPYCPRPRHFSFTSIDFF